MNSEQPKISKQKNSLFTEYTIDDPPTTEEILVDPNLSLPSFLFYYIKEAVQLMMIESRLALVDLIP